MIYLADTNILLRVMNRSDPLHIAARSALWKLRASRHKAQTTPQNCTEFWNVATRPVSGNGLGMTLGRTNRWLRVVERIIPMLPDSQAVYPQWRRLVVTYGVSGSKVHDARLVAFMLVYQVTHILTLNTADFLRYSPEGIVAIDPRTV
jgi:predicted nucleic acid-binding protein